MKRVIKWYKYTPTQCRACPTLIRRGDLAIANQTHRTNHYCLECGVALGIVDEIDIVAFRNKLQLKVLTSGEVLI